jgi:cellulose synthase (UDP-forming)
MLWGNLYETTVSFSLFRSLFDLLRPRQLGFKVTPKGVVSEKRAFDLRSTKVLLLAALINIIAIAKGLWEFFYFGIEKDAYFFNLGWASFNLLLLLGGLLIAWEKPQRRTRVRIFKTVPFELQFNDVSLKGKTHDLSLSGFSFLTEEAREVPTSARITFTDDFSIACRCRLAYHERVSTRSSRCGFEIVDLDEETRRKLSLKIFTSPDTWETGHDGRVRSNIVMALHFLAGVVRCFLPLKNSKRKDLRKKSFQIRPVKVEGQTLKVCMRDFSSWILPRRLSISCGLPPGKGVMQL